MKLIVGLGNPGSRYSHSRHNVGFRCVDRMAREWDIKLAQRRKTVVLGEGHVGGELVVLAKPRTYMNCSGKGIKYLLTRFHAAPGDLLIIHDDMDLPPGKIRIRPGGSGAGHRGLESIIDTVSSQEFPRARVGIGKPPVDVEGADYVLETVPSEERQVLEGAVEVMPEAVLCLLRDGIEAAMNKFN